VTVYLARVYVILKPAVNDPQGVTVKGGLLSLGFSGVKEVRMGKYIELQIDAPDAASAGDQVEEMSRKLLTNPIIEDFRFDLTEA
jgi:phosphoribosylformylglycinamidine synthase